MPPLDYAERWLIDSLRVLRPAAVSYQTTIDMAWTRATRGAPARRQQERDRLAALRRWGWLVPFGFLRRAVMRHLFASASFRRQTAGTFQVSTVPVESAAASVFVAAGVLVGGLVKSRVVAVDGHPIVRPTMGSDPFRRPQRLGRASGSPVSGGGQIRSRDAGSRRCGLSGDSRAKRALTSIYIYTPRYSPRFSDPAIISQRTSRLPCAHSRETPFIFNCLAKL